MVTIFKMSAKTHQNLKVLQFKWKLIFRRNVIVTNVI